MTPHAPAFPSPGGAEFPHHWRAKILAHPPLIAPARHFTFPRPIPGEEEALARGALHLLVHPAPGEPPFLALCALGFTDPAMPTAVHACPNPAELCAVAGGYAYLIDTVNPARSTHLALRPVAQVLPLPEHDLLLFLGFHTLVAWGPNGLAWETERLSWEGLRVTGCDNHLVHGFGWDMPTDREVPFSLDLATGRRLDETAPASALPHPSGKAAAVRSE